MRSIHHTLLALSVVALAGCAATASPDWVSKFGDRTRMVHAQQLLDPNAPTRHGQTQPRGDGRTTSEAIGRHVESYRSPPPSNVINIGVGAGR